MALINDDNTTTKVDVVTLHGDVVSISKELENGFVTIADMEDPEVMFWGDSICLTGYCKTAKDFVYEMKSFRLKRR